MKRRRRGGGGGGEKEEEGGDGSENMITNTVGYKGAKTTCALDNLYHLPIIYQCQKHYRFYLSFKNSFVFEWQIL